MCLWGISGRIKRRHESDFSRETPDLFSLHWKQFFSRGTLSQQCTGRSGRIINAYWLHCGSSCPRASLISHSILLLRLQRRLSIFLGEGCRTWTACLRARTGLCVWAGRGRLGPRCRAGGWRCTLRGVRRTVPASSAGPAPNAAAFLKRRDKEGRPRADLQRRQRRRWIIKQAGANKDTIGLSGKQKEVRWSEAAPDDIPDEITRECQ